MLKIALIVLYYICKVVLFPLESMWNSMFGIELNVKDRVICTGTVGGSRKSTLASEISKKYGHAHVKLDNHKFGANWKRFTDEEYKTNLKAELLSIGDGPFVIDGTFSDDKLPAQYEENKSMFEGADLIVWQDIPKWVSVWRKGFRSFKRYIDVTEQGTAPEKLHNVIEMLKKTMNTYEVRHERLSKEYDGKPVDKYKRITWPYFYKVTP